MFLNDLTVATGRPEADSPGPSNAENVIGAVSHSRIPSRNMRSCRTMGLRATAFAGSVVGAEGETLFNSVAPIEASYVGAMILLMLAALLFARCARGRLSAVQSIVLVAKPLVVDALGLDAMHFVVMSMAAMIGGTGLVYGTWKDHANWPRNDRRFRRACGVDHCHWQAND